MYSSGVDEIKNVNQSLIPVYFNFAFGRGLKYYAVRTQKMHTVNFTSRISTPPEPVFKNFGQQMPGPDSSIG